MTRAVTRASTGSAAALRDAIRALEHALLVQRRAGPPAAATLSAADLRALDCVARAPGPLSVGEVAERLRRHPSSASVSMGRLLARGLVRREADPADRRRCLHAVTPAGRRLADQAPDRVLVALEGALAGWPAGRARMATGLLRQLAEALTPDEGATARAASARRRRAGTMA